MQVGPWRPNQLGAEGLLHTVRGVPPTAWGRRLFSRALPRTSEARPKASPSSMPSDATSIGLVQLRLVIGTPVATLVPTVHAKPHTIAGVTESSRSLEACTIA